MQMQSRKLSEANGFIKEILEGNTFIINVDSGCNNESVGCCFFRDNTISLVWYILAYLPVGFTCDKKKHGRVFFRKTLVSLR